MYLNKKEGMSDLDAMKMNNEMKNGSLEAD